MKNVIFGFILAPVITAVIFLQFMTLGACTQKQIPTAPTTPMCLLPAKGTLNEAISQTKNDLINPRCQLRFEAYFERLLEIASGDPAMENKRRFSDFLLWAKSKGILTMVQSKDYYNRYFNTTFMALPDDYNVCSSASKKDHIIKAVERELGQKELGLMKACADKQTYYQAHEQYNALLLVFDAVCLACEQDRK